MYANLRFLEFKTNKHFKQMLSISFLKLHMLWKLIKTFGVVLG